MNLLDTRTVLISYGISSLISVAVMASLWAEHRRRSPGLAFWLADFIMQFLGLLLIVLRGHLPDFFSVVLSNTLIIVGTLVLLIGLERYYGKAGRQWFNYFYLGLFFFIQMIFLYIQPSLQWRNINISVGILVMCGQCAWLLIRRVEPSLRPGARPAVIVLGLFSLASLVRIYIDLAVPQGTDVFKSGLYDTLVILIYQMLFIGLTFTLVMLVNRRLNLALREDISERKRAEQALQESQASLHAILQSSADGILAVNHASQVLFTSERFMEMWRIPPDVRTSQEDEVFLQHVLDQLSDPRGFLQKVRQLYKSTEESIDMLDFKDGRMFERLSQPLMQAGELRGRVWSFRDITERKLAEQKLKEYSGHLEEMVAERTHALKEAQEQLLRQERLAVLGQMAGSVGHELRNPLGVINTSIYYLKTVLEDPGEKVRKHLDIIAQQVHTSDKIIGDLLGFARDTSVEREKVPVAELVKKMLERFPVPAEVELMIELPEDLPMLYADPRQMEQVLGNLVTNACQAMKEGGQLTIRGDCFVAKNAPRNNCVECQGRKRSVMLAAYAMADWYAS